ncbi:MAG: hypothetical protein V5A61_07720 [Haloarculaceae archaeon]
MSFERARQVYRTKGLVGFLFVSVRYVYRMSLLALYVDHLRDRLPKRDIYYTYNGVSVPVERGWLDAVVPLYVDGKASDNPTYEYAEVGHLKEKLSEGDDVVIVGGGWGVTAVTAAREVGPEGSVTVYEPNVECYRKCEKVVAANGVADVVELNHAVVGEIVSLDWSRGGEERTGDARVLHPEDLPPADVYELDCEGAEVPILEGIEVRPEWFVIETHGIHGAPKERTVGILEGVGYEVEDVVRGSEGLHVLTARYTASG